jgi:hypothetical protein
MRNLLAAIIVVFGIVFAVGGCDESIEEPGCDLFLGRATASGTAYDFDGAVLAGADIEFTIADTSVCEPDFRGIIGRGRSGDDGTYSVTLRAGNIAGERCVFGRIVGSDSISAGRVHFTSDCDRTEPVYDVAMDLVFPASSVIPDDLKIALYRLHAFSGPHYQVTVDAAGHIEFEAINDCAVPGVSEADVDLVTVARLYRAFEAIKYWKIPSIHYPEECERYAYDIHYCTTSLAANGRLHFVVHDHGCYGIDVLNQLTELECEVDRVLDTIRWTGKDAWPCR